jgi:hypothetical protein
MGCGSSGSEKNYSIKVFAVNVDCQFAEEVTLDAQNRFLAVGIPLKTDFKCVTWDKTYEFGEKEKALSELSAKFGPGHYLVPRFGAYFDGVAFRNRSISVAVVGRLRDSAEQMAHEVAHTLGASHDTTNCNVMRKALAAIPRRHCGYDAQFNHKAIEEMS